MATQLVFNGNLDPASPNLSTRFIGATIFFIEAPTLNAELEIDVYLQVYLPGIIGETVRNVPLGKIEEQSILLNVTDTETANLIPTEYQNTGLEMALLFLASDTTYLYAIAVSPKCNLCQLKAQNDAIQDTQTIMQATLQQILDAVNQPVPTSAPTTTQQQFFYLQ